LSGRNHQNFTADTQDRNKRFLSACLEESPTMRSPPGYRPKILKKRDFVRIDEFHSGSKRATGGTRGLRAAGAGDPDSPRGSAAGALFEV
jgi:hypothetical protein